MEKVSRKEREHFVHRGEILQAAEKIFATKGFFHSSMSEIAGAAEFGTGTLYKYFRSKEDLYFTLIDEKTEEVNRLILDELSQESSAVDRIKRVLRLQLEFMERNRNFFKIYISERNRFEWTVKDDLGKGIHDKMIAYIDFLARVMKQGIKDKEFKPLDPVDMAHAFVGIVNSFLFEWLIRSQPYSILSKMDTMLEIFLGGTQRMERRR